MGLPSWVEVATGPPRSGWRFDAAQAPIPDTVRAQVESDLADFDGSGASVLQLSFSDPRFRVAARRGEGDARRTAGVAAGVRSPVPFRRGQRPVRAGPAEPAGTCAACRLRRDGSLVATGDRRSAPLLQRGHRGVPSEQRAGPGSRRGLRITSRPNARICTSPPTRRRKASSSSTCPGTSRFPRWRT